MVIDSYTNDKFAYHNKTQQVWCGHLAAPDLPDLSRVFILGNRYWPEPSQYVTVDIIYIIMYH
jgi:hypothetical protein